MKIITWVFCEDCFRKDEKRHDIPNFQTERSCDKESRVEF